jgi:hypothetical protein
METRDYSLIEWMVKDPNITVEHEGDVAKYTKKYKRGRIEVEGVLLVDRKTEKILSFKVKYSKLSRGAKKFIEKFAKKSLMDINFQTEDSVEITPDMKRMKLYEVREILEELEEYIRKK